MKGPFYCTGFNEDMDARSLLVSVDTGDETAVIQSGKDDADINTLVERFGVTTLGMSGPISPLLFGDFTGVGDFRSAIDAVRAGEESFMQLPGQVRAMFENDAQRFVEWCEARDDKGALVNIEDLRKHGLAVPADTGRKPIQVEVVPPPTPPSKP